ncbi:MAG: 3-oxoacyl-[acyl-carrier-protein] reductase [Bacteroidales bacterium]|nr:3-oxoacyl-[acyl-carrier-protein] reductase [Bacteroidales bacterium]MCF8328424.1 3-oxoacyl-[acyl-carrier-protein] reductase [Bacteroidales bacterium]
MDLLKGKTAIITGAARGIGKTIALEFARQGANIAISDLKKDENLESTAKEIEATGAKVLALASDASNFEEAQNFIDKIAKEFGTIDILVNNAGITRDNLLMRMGEKDFDMVINVNLKSVFNLTKAVQRTMLKQRSGSIINMASIVGLTGNAGQSNYAASKSGIIGFTKSVAQELGSRNIRCNAVAPGFIVTEMTGQLDENVRKEWIKTIPLKREGKPEDVAKACVFLGSDLSDYITGQVLSVDGGMHT